MNATKLSFLILLISSLNGIAQVPNSGFENWGATYSQPIEPTDYISANVLASPFVSSSNPTSVTQETGTNAHSGTYAAKIKTVKLVSNPTSGAVPDTVGVAMLGSIQISPSVALKSGVPFTQRMNSLSFYYKYQPVAADKGAVASYLTRWNVNHRDTLATAIQLFSTSVTSYSLANVSFTYSSSFPSSAIPDTLHLYFLSSARPWLKNTASTANLGSSLWIDDASIVGINEQFKILNNFKTYPNPATYYFIFHSNEQLSKAQISIYNSLGAKVQVLELNTSEVKLNTSNYEDGIYFYSIVNTNNLTIGSGKLIINKKQ